MRYLIKKSYSTAYNCAGRMLKAHELLDIKKAWFLGHAFYNAIQLI